MTIKRKNIRPSGLLEVEADPTDLVDLNGFSDIINTVGAAKTAQFSDTSVMQANSGLKIGLTQVKIINEGGVVRIGVVIRGSFVATVATGEVVVVDFGNIGTADLSGTIQYNSGNSNTNLEFSTDDITYFLADNITGSNLNNTYTPTTQTYRYARIFVITNPGVVTPQTIFEIATTSDVTINIRSSATLNTADGSILLASEVIPDNVTVTFNADLLLTGLGQFVTLEILSFNNQDVDVSLSEITSIKEV